jgi:hypothetical protein
VRRLGAPRHVRIFLASPGDVVAERQAVREVLERIERSPLVRGTFTIETVSWDDPDAPVPMLAALTPQQAVSRALPRPSECDFTIVIIAGRMGTPLDEAKPDGTPYRSGTEWEFEDARRAGKPVLLYRRTAVPALAGAAGPDEVHQLRSVEQFFSQFKAPSGALLGGVTTYKDVAELTARIKTDIESLLPALARHEDVPADGWIARAQSAVGRWRHGRLLLVFVAGIFLSVVAWTAFASFSTAMRLHDAPAGAHAIRYAFLSLGILVPLALIVVTWWWLGRESPPRTD